MDKIEKTLVKAHDIHKNQARKKTKFPYFVHILDVAKYLMYETKDKDVICARILHDSLENTPYTKEELTKDFGDKVFSLVNFCTEPENTPDATKEQQKESWKRN